VKVLCKRGLRAHPKENLRLEGRTGLLLSVSGATCRGGGGSGSELKEAASSGRNDGTVKGPGCGSLLPPSSGMSLHRHAADIVVSQRGGNSSPSLAEGTGRALVVTARYLQILACPSCAISQQLCSCAMAPNTMMHFIHPASHFIVGMKVLL
jgi:hypothetical protein